MLGLPPRHVLDSGLHTLKYFCSPDGQTWVHKMNPHGCEDLHLFVDLIKRLLDMDPDSRRLQIIPSSTHPSALKLMTQSLILQSLPIIQDVPALEILTQNTTCHLVLYHLRHHWFLIPHHRTKSLNTLKLSPTCGQKRKREDVEEGSGIRKKRAKEDVLIRNTSGELCDGDVQPLSSHVVSAPRKQEARSGSPMDQSQLPN
uniref:Uncharacterized protein n=1 Tax=Knipowitschia caucasica TaxID=637954 RepID=A0AAV2K8F1_KNICA